MMDTNEMLYLLRNPFGHSEDDVRTARLKAADIIELIEKLKQVTANYEFGAERRLSVLLAEEEEIARLQHEIDRLIENADV